MNAPISAIADGTLRQMFHHPQALRLLLAGIKLLGSVSASALNTLEPAFASLTSMAVFGEAMGLLKGCGVILVLAAAVIGILTLNRDDSKTRSKA